MQIYSLVYETLYPNGIGQGGKIHHATQNLVENARVRTIKNTALIKQISLFDTTLVMTNT